MEQTAQNTGEAGKHALWRRKELKQRSRHTLRKNYGAALAVIFLLAMLAGLFGGVPSLLGSYNAAVETQDAVMNPTGPQQTAAQVVKQSLENFLKSHPNESNFNTFMVKGTEIALDWFADSRGTVMALLRIANGFVSNHAVVTAWILLAGLAVRLLYWAFGANLLEVGGCRFFLENRLYSGTRIGRIFFVYRHRQVKNVARVMFLRALYQFLWSLTIVGGFIKMYEYSMIPWLLAENPEMDAKTAFALSRRMMHGNKWRAFVLDLSYMGWFTLSVFTFDLLAILYVYPYRQGARAELYAVLREGVIDEGGPEAQQLDDTALYTLDGQPEVARPVYPASGEGSLELPHVELHMPKALRPFRADRKYSVMSLILLFFFFSMFGWLWEVSLHLVQDGVFVNRGTMLGPWLPIYGSGGVLIIVLLRRFMKKPVLTFFLTILVCGTVEYGTSWYLETTRGIKWWDYSGYFLNINGRICFLSMVVFGLGGCAFLYYIAPRVDDLIEKIPHKIQLGLCIVLCTLFGIDAVYSVIHPNVGPGITDYPTSEEMGAAAAGLYRRL